MCGAMPVIRNVDALSTSRDVVRIISGSKLDIVVIIGVPGIFNNAFSSAGKTFFASPFL
jgi:hypothetical protein